MPRTVLLFAALAALTLAAYWRVGGCEFLAFDDPSYVTDNPMVNQGLRTAAFLWAFTAPHGVNWHPLTTLCHAAAVSLFEVQAAAHHWVNVAWHAVNAGLVFLVWRRLGGATWPAALVAALFALHPLHVESVAWVSELKDVLSTACWLGTLWAYLRYVERPGRGRYALVAAGTALALMSKPMAVTLPGTLLLLDYWPLGRWRERGWAALVWEKAPLFLLAAMASVVTLHFQHGGGAGEAGAQWSLAARVGNAAVSCVRYLGKTAWPAGLSPFYPHPGAWPWWAVAGSLGVIGTVSWVAWRERERRGWLLFGWGWYLGTLVPVLGLVQVGSQAMADRYTYVPLLGVFTILAWGGAEAVGRRPSWRGVLALAAGAALAGCLFRTWQQVPVWQNSLRVAQQMHAVAGEHPVVYRMLAVAAAHAGRPPAEIEALYRRGLAVAPDDDYLLLNLAMNAARAGRDGQAQELFTRAQARAPQHRAVPAARGLAWIERGRFAEAIGELARARELGPRDGYTHRLLAEAYAGLGRAAEAREALLAAIGCDRWDWQAWANLALVEAALGRHAEAIAAVERAQWINPGDRGLAEILGRVRGR
jgi:tetratricopeptide (TPR) repeat protein